jgi:hypothetical protein
MALRDIIRGAKNDTKHPTLARLAPLAVAKSITDVDTMESFKAKSYSSFPESTSANLANVANDKVPLTPYHFELFELLYLLLKEKNRWLEDDYQAWFQNLNDDPELTLNCLEAIHYSLTEGRYGVIEPKDWGRSVQLFKGLTIEQSKISSLRIAQREPWDNRKLCVECKHLISFNGSWKCGNWEKSGEAIHISGSGLNWEMITLFKKCNGFEIAYFSSS